MTGDNNFCSKCGGKIQSEDEYCSKCGYRLSDEKEAEPKRRVSKHQMNIIIGVLFFCIVILLLGHSSSQHVTNPVSDPIPDINPVPQDTMLSFKTYAYVANRDDNTVSVIDTATNKVTSTVPVGLCPVEVAVSPDGKKVYVSNFNSSNISVIDTNTNSVTDTVAVNGKMTVSPDSSKLYVLNPIEDISVVDTSTYFITDEMKREVKSYNAIPTNIAISQDGTKLYVVNVNSNSVSIIDTTTEKDIYDIFVGRMFEGGILEIAVSPDGTKVYVPYLSPYSGQDTIAVIDTTTYTVINPIHIDFIPGDVAVSPDGTKLYVSDPFGKSVSVFDTATYRLIHKVIGIDQPYHIAITPDGTKVYVTNFKNNNTVYAINVTTNTVTDRIPVGNHPEAIAIGKIRTA